MRVDHKGGVGPLGHLPAVTGQAVSGHVSDRVNTRRGLQEFARCTIERLHALDGRALVIVVASGEHDAGAEWFGDHEDVAHSRTLFAEDAIGVHHTLYGETEDGFGIADGVSASDAAAGRGHHRRGGVEDGDDRVAREVFGEGRHVDGQHDPTTHGEDVAARVGGGDGAEVGRIVHQGREEVGGAHESQVGAEAIDRGVVERGQAHQEGRVERGREFVDQAGQEVFAPLGGAASTRGPLREPQWRRTRYGRHGLSLGVPPPPSWVRKPGKSAGLVPHGMRIGPGRPREARC